MTLRLGLGRVVFAVAALLMTLAGATAGTLAPVETFAISARQISRFQIGRDETRFGPLEFVGGLEMTATARNFGGLSAFRFLSPGADFIGVADTGFWFFGRLVHDAEGRPAGIEGFRMQQMVEADGRPVGEKWLVDAEGLDVRDGIATVSFERKHRISQFRIDPQNMKAPFAHLDFLVPARELRQNRGFETVANAPEDGALRGAVVVVAEKSLDREGNIYAAILQGPQKGVFTVRRHGDFDIVDGAFLPGGDLLVLERRFSMARGVGMRLRRLAGETIAKGSIADGPILLEADMNYQIDNMEGLDVWRRQDGLTMVSLISDDNHSLFQRNLYLEFILHEDE